VKTRTSNATLSKEKKRKILFFYFLFSVCFEKLKQKELKINFLFHSPSIVLEPKIQEFQSLHTPLNPGKMLIEANAGSGKTTSLVRIFLRLCLEKGFKAKEIVLLTFTNKAAQELKDRLFKEVQNLSLWKKSRQAKAELSLQLEEQLKTEWGFSFEEMDSFLKKVWAENAKYLHQLCQAEEHDFRVNTIHSFCAQILKDYAWDSALFPIDQTGDFFPEVFKEAYQRFWRKENEKEEQEPSAVDFLEESTAGYFEKILRITLNYPDLEIYSSQKKALEKDAKLGTKSEKEEEASIKSGKKKAPQRKNSQAENSHAKELEKIIEVQAFYFQLCAEKKFLHYSDLIRWVHSLVQNEKTLSSYFQERPFYALLVDEFQDTDQRQLEIFSALFQQQKDEEESYQIFVGDPKQAIYKFRGADIHVYLKEKANLIQKEKNCLFFLSQNYRSDPLLLEGINIIFKESAYSFGSDLEESDEASEKKTSLLEYHPSQFPNHKQGSLRDLYQWEEKNIPPIEIHQFSFSNFEKEKQTKEHLFSTLQPLIFAWLHSRLGLDSSYSLGGKKITPKDVCILVNSNDQASKLAELLHADFPVEFVERDQKNEQGEKKDILLFFQNFLFAIENPLEIKALNALLSGPPFFLGDEDLFFLQKDSAKQAACFQILVNLSQPFSQLEILPLIQSLISQLKPFHLVNFDLQMQKNAEFFSSLEGAFIALQGLQNKVGIKKLTQELQKEDALKKLFPVQPFASKEAIKIFTIHGAKGLEFPIVLCPFLWEEKQKNRRSHLPDPKREKGKWRLDLDGKFQEQPLDEYCKLYTAMTRAQHALVLFSPEEKSYPKGPLNNLFQRKTTQTSDALAEICLQNTNSFRLDLHKFYGNGQEPESSFSVLKNLSLKKNLPPKNRSREENMNRGEKNQPCFSAPTLVKEIFLAPLASREEKGIEQQKNPLFPYRGVASYSKFKKTTPTPPSFWEEDAEEEKEPTLLLGLQEKEDQTESSLPSKKKGLDAFPKNNITGLYIHDLLAHWDLNFDALQPLLSFAEKEESKKNFSDQISIPQRLKNFHLPNFSKESVEFLTSLKNFSFHEGTFPFSKALKKNFFPEWPFTLHFDSWPKELAKYWLELTKLAGSDEKTWPAYLVGRIDAIFDQNDSLFVVDWKTDDLKNYPKEKRKDFLKKYVVEKGYWVQGLVYQYALACHFSALGLSATFFQKWKGVQFVFLRLAEQNSSPFLVQDPTFDQLLKKHFLV